MINRLRISCTSRAYWEIVGPLSEWHSRYISFTVSLRTGLLTLSHPHLMARKKRKKEKKVKKNSPHIFFYPHKEKEKKKQEGKESLAHTPTLSRPPSPSHRTQTLLRPLTQLYMRQCHLPGALRWRRQEA